MKKFLRHPAVAHTLAFLVATYSRLIFCTTRTRIVTPVPAAMGQGAVVIATWHQQLAFVPILRRPVRGKLLALMSASRDGTLIRLAAAWFGIGAVVGSSSRGAVSGARALVQEARSGNSLFITPDGPRGPANIAKPGATEVARLTHLPLIPCAAWCGHGKTFRSWDAFRFPYPFATITVAYGEPLAPLTPAALQQALNTLTAQAQGPAALASQRSRP